MRISDWSSDVCSSDLLALRYAHVGDAHSKHIAYATGKKFVYGPKFAELDRFSQAFVVFHEVMHHVLAHLEHGALLYKREGARFNFIAFNIACDAIINYVAEALPDVDKSAGSIRYGVRRCQEFGIVNWSKIVKEMQSLVATTGIALDPVFTRKPTELSCVDIYYALMRSARQVSQQQESAPSDSDNDDITNSTTQRKSAA